MSSLSARVGEMANFPTPAGPLIQCIDEAGSADPITCNVSDIHRESSDDRSGLENQMLLLLLDRRHQGEDRYLVLDWLPFHQPKRSWSPDRPYWFAMLVIDCALNLLIMKSLVLGNIDMVVDRRWEQEAVEFMSTCEHRSPTNQPWRILPMFDLSPPTQSCVTTGPLSEKWECCRTWTDAVQPKRLQRLRHESVISPVLHNIALIHPGCRLGKGVWNRVLYRSSKDNV